MLLTQPLYLIFFLSYFGFLLACLLFVLLSVFVLRVWGIEDKDDAFLQLLKPFMQRNLPTAVSMWTGHLPSAYPLQVACRKGEEYIFFWENSVICGEIQKNHCNRCRVMTVGWVCWIDVTQTCWGAVHAFVRCKKLRRAKLPQNQNKILLKAKAKT